jgi:hypothetical protein
MKYGEKTFGAGGNCFVAEVKFNIYHRKPLSHILMNAYVIAIALFIIMTIVIKTNFNLTAFLNSCSVSLNFSFCKI